MRIVVLDGYTLNPGDLSWKRLEELGDVTVYDRTPINKVVQRGERAQILLTNKTPVREEAIQQLDRLEYIGVLATGYDVVDIHAAKDRGIVVTNIPTYGTDSVAQMVFALLLELCRNVAYHSAAVKKGEWSASEDFCFWSFPQLELAQKTMGLIGFGRIGRKVGEIASAMGMPVLASDKETSSPPEKIESFRWVDTESIFEEADIISLHCPLTPETEGLIQRKSLEKMRPTSFLINTSRGGLVVDDHLAEALNKGAIAGAGLDVLSKEPPALDNPLMSAKNCIITPHISWATKEARARLLEMAIENLRSYLKKKPIHVVNG